MSSREKGELHPDIERLILRQLDGPLGADEELALNREMIRNPRARAVADEYRRVDQWSARALEGLDADEGSVRNAIAAIDGTLLRTAAPRHGYSRAWWFLPAAIAAALGFAAVTRDPFAPQGRSPIVVREGLESLPSANALPTLRGDVMSLEPVRRASTSEAPRRNLTRDTDRELIGVLGEDGTIYWLEVDRTRTILEPNRQPEIRRAGGDL